MIYEIRKITSSYSVANDGVVWSFKFGKIRPLKPSINDSGYMTVFLTEDGRHKKHRIHRLVAKAFLPPQPTPSHEINHKNGDKTDNRASNLEWVTRCQNMQHSHRVLGHAAPPVKFGESNNQSKITLPIAERIRYRRNNGEGRNALAREFGISGTHVADIANGKYWRPQ